LRGKIWYTCGMSTTDHSLPNEQSMTCASHSMERAMQLIGDVWTLKIIYTLMTGTRRFGEILEVMGNVSPKTLSNRLKMLEEIKFVQRRAFAEIPPRVEYRLTERGFALANIMEAINQFGERYLSDVEPMPPNAPSASSSCQ
jgi:DNA-binding HxlR family transcriptional regulator